nr:MAG TPA: hypothetical protein [Caudoviricetes sp.]
MFDSKKKLKEEIKRLNLVVKNLINENTFLENQLNEIHIIFDTLKASCQVTIDDFTTKEKFYNSQIKELQNMIHILKPLKKDGTTYGKNNL